MSLQFTSGSDSEPRPYASSRRPRVSTGWRKDPRLNEREIGYFFSSTGWPQQWTVPFPPRVTMNSAPHFLQTYLLPT